MCNIWQSMSKQSVLRYIIVSFFDTTIFFRVFGGKTTFFWTVGKEVRLPQ